MRRNLNEGRIHFSLDVRGAIGQSLVTFIAVGTPMGRSGAADLSSVFRVVEEIAGAARGYHVVAIKSTVPVGTNDQVKDLLAKGQKKILLNLGDVNYIDSSGIGELVSAYTTVRNQGGELKLLNLTKKVHDLLQITKLYTVFDVKDDETAAVKAFR